MSNFGSMLRASLRAGLKTSRPATSVALLAAVAVQAVLSGCSGEAGEQGVPDEQGEAAIEQAGQPLLQTRPAALTTVDDQSFEVEGAAPDRTLGADADGQTLAKAETFTCTLTSADNGWTYYNDCVGSEGTWCWTQNQWQGGHWGGWSAYVCVSASGVATYY